MSFLKRFFGLKSDKPQARRLNHPSDIRTGDIITFHYHSIEDISNKTFEVFKINTYLYGNICYPEIILKDESGNVIFMMVEEEDGEEYLCISKKVGKAQIRDILSEDELSAIIDSGTGTHITLSKSPAGFDGWLADSYLEVDDNVIGSFIKGDARYLSDKELDQREDFSSFILEDYSEEKALELEVYATGEMELSATVYLEISEIAEMLPGSFTPPTQD